VPLGVERFVLQQGVPAPPPRSIAAWFCRARATRATPAFEGDCEIQQRECAGKMCAEGSHPHLEEFSGILLLHPLSCERLPCLVR
jgi:hypothetical protein